MNNLIKYKNVGHYHGVPSEVGQGDSITVCFTVEGYSPVEAVATIAVGNSEGVAFTVDSVNIDGDFYFLIPSDSTSELTGEYVYQITLVEMNDRITLDNGFICFQRDIVLSGSTEKSHAEITLDKVQKAIEGKMSSDVAEYVINGRSLKRYSIESLLMLRDKYRREVNAEKRAKKFGGSRKIRVRF